MRINRLVFYYLITIILTVIMPFIASCAGDNESENNRFLELLNLLPATAQSDGLFVLIDYEKIWQDNGISLYDSNNQTTGFEDTINAIIYFPWEDNPDAYTLGFGSYYTSLNNDSFISPIKEKYIGYDFRNVDAEINNFRNKGYSGTYYFFTENMEEKFNFEPDLKVAAIGRFDPEATEYALGNRNEWPSWTIESYQSERYYDINVHSWGDIFITHLKDRRSPPNLDALGRALPFALSDKHIFIGYSVDIIKSMIDSSLENLPSLADLPEYVLLARGLYELGAYHAAVVGDEGILNIYTENSSAYQGPPLKHFVTFGAGYGKDENGAYRALVLVHDNPDIALENVSLLEQRINTIYTDLDMSNPLSSDLTYIRWSYSVIIDDTEIYTEGNVLLAKLYMNNPLSISQYWHRVEHLLLHEH